MPEQETTKRIQVACVVPYSVNEEMKLMGKPGGICTSIVKSFYKVIKNTFSIKPTHLVESIDGSLVYTAHHIDKGTILLTIKNGDKVTVLEMDELAACRIILNINSVLNIEE